MLKHKTFSYEAIYKVKDKKRRRKKRVYLVVYATDTRADLFYKSLVMAINDTEDDEILNSIQLIEEEEQC